MSLTRPAWRVTIASPGKWSYTITQGDEPFGGDLEFVPPLTYGFAFDDDQLPSPIGPDSLTFRLFARNTAALPELVEGQVLTFLLERPLEAGARRYAASLMRITDLSGSVDRLPATYVDVVAVDVLAAFRARQVTLALPLEDRPDRLSRLAAAARVTIAHDLPAEASILAPLKLEEKSAGDVAQEALNVDPWDVLRPAAGTDPHAFEVVHLDPDAKLANTLFEFYRIGLEPVRLRDREGLPAADDFGIMLDADYVTLSPTWRRGKESRINKTIAQGVENPADVQPVVAAAEHRRLVDEFGESSRTHSTHLWETDRLEQSAQRALPQQADAVSSWAVDELTVDTSLMPDDVLDLIAPYFVPQADGTGSQAPPSSIAVLRIPDAVSLGRIAGRVTQARFAIEAGGKLTITPRILPGVPRSPYAVSYAEWRASSLADATYSPADVDPAITYAQAKLARIAGSVAPVGLFPSALTFPSLDLFPTED